MNYNEHAKIYGLLCAGRKLALGSVAISTFFLRMYQTLCSLHAHMQCHISYVGVRRH